LFTTNTALLNVDNLTLAIAGVVPPPNMTTDTINQLMHIFKQQAETVKNNATVQRVLKERAHAERMLNEAEPNPTPTTTPSAAPTTNPTTTFPDLEIRYPNSDVGPPRKTPVASQDDYESVSQLYANTRQQCRDRTITEDFLFHMMDMYTPTQPFTTQQAPSRKFPLPLLCNFASANLITRLNTFWNIAICWNILHTKTYGTSFLARKFEAL
jgi:hypothetical protein